MPVSIKIDSNITGLRAAEEVSLGVLGAASTQRWVEQEPNSYSDFGGNVTTIARNPINPGRQRKKGVVTNVEATAGFNADLTQANFQDMLRGFFYANYRNKQEFTSVAITVASPANTYAATGIGTGFFAGDLFFATGFTNTANNGVKRITAQAANLLTVAETLVAETSPITARIVAVGFQGASGDITLTNSGSSFPVLGATAKDLTQLGLIPGEWIYIGGDLTAERFATATNNGFARVRSVSATQAVLDKTQATTVTDTGTSKTIRIFKGRVLKNEIGTSIIRRSYTMERTLGISELSTPTLEQAQYVSGAVPNEFTLNLQTADKAVCDLAFIATNSFTIDEVVSGTNTLLSKIASVVRVPVVEADAFNTSSDFSRIRLSVVSTTNGFPAPLFTYSEEATITINNNNSPNNALGVFGAFEVTAGTFEVGGSITAYFGDVASIAAVRNNSDITLDMILVKANAGIALDLPLLALGGGLPSVEQDQPVTIPLELNAATAAKITSTMNHTMLMVFFDYLPNAADL